MIRTLTALSLALCVTGCEDVAWEGDYDSGLETYEWARGEAEDSAASSLCRGLDVATPGCENVRSSFTLQNSDTLCWRGNSHGYFFAVPVNGRCPTQYNGPIALNQSPLNRWSTCQLASFLVGAPAACADGCTDRGVQVNTDATTTSCTATQVRVCSEPIDAD